MQSIKQETDSGESYSGEDALLLAVALQGPNPDLMGHNISAVPFKAKMMCRRKREFIPEEKKDTVYWERRRKNNEAAKRSREKRRINDMVLENKLMALGEENASLKAELLSLKLKFGLVSSAAYAQEVQKLSSSSSASCQRPFLSPHGGQEPLPLRSSCISVIKHSPLLPETTQGRFAVCRTADIKQEPAENGSYAQERSSPYELYRNCMASRLSDVYSQPASFMQATRSSSNSPRTSEDGAVCKSSDGEDEQQVPKGLTPSVADPRSVIVSTHNVPDTGSAALPHKLRIKSRTTQIKVEAVDPEYESSGKSSSPVSASEGDCYQNSVDQSEYTQAPHCPLSLQVTRMQHWTQRSGSKQNPGSAPTQTFLDVQETWCGASDVEGSSAAPADVASSNNLPPAEPVSAMAPSHRDADV
ncbi:nuclear factor interleukin-3-regulated protein [Melanotaenia boesemani]|uniref:nuclear factor interleukin-3-regulated protein n=1 Tax=Melanotaenia boesemani TaxID=1250792 RepID=UPI001C047D9E|nr:nuclear factor interleukin-3-regulated protein [Melanotaenia boesemani]XP_041826225.1 nuclear factor interleukin-3-regulated protein [Melanotaenia boesemani]XP_041826226.1 nuclear factor interleukin-3-regulated protein [Melanotaenia boesemani]XP_041826227.1 nuclear factor interleukin-3-regulated protein [Melanotaenia boesemani]XP_041826228.1 nuclear factor interleukin-3-regulated protein [Melanotaenia boesemani]